MPLRLLPGTSEGSPGALTNCGGPGPFFVQLLTVFFVIYISFFPYSLPFTPISCSCEQELLHLCDKVYGQSVHLLKDVGSVGGKSEYSMDRFILY